jgi:misacylated tRNA(Ala) deacylase
MTEKLYYADTYRRDFEAEIVAVGSDGLTLALDRSAFYPGGGGQPCDLGTLTIDAEPYTVTEVFHSDGTIWHRLNRAVPLEFKGRGVQAALDWERRYSHMRYHTALHLLNGVAFHTYGALVTGAQVYADRARVDFTLEDLSSERVQYLEREMNVAAQKALPLNAREITQTEAAQMPELIRTLNAMPPQVEKVRIVEIEGLDRQFCGGTHLHNASEAGHITISGTRSKGKQNKRIEITIA